MNRNFKEKKMLTNEEVIDKANLRLEAYVGMLKILKTISPATNNVQAPLCVLAEGIISIAMELNEMNRLGRE